MEIDEEDKRRLLPNGSEVDAPSKRKDSVPQRIRHTVLKSSILFSAVIVVSTILYLVFFIRWTHSIAACKQELGEPEDIKTKGPQTLSCGKTREDAIARGCIFDVLSVGWVPPACYDKDRAEAFKNMTTIVSYGRPGPFPWYRDANHTIPIAESELSGLGDHPVAYTTEEFHQGHCLYVWQTTSAALNEARKQEGGVWALDRIGDHHHIQHCLIVLESMPWRYNKSVEVDFGYRDCIKLDVYG